MNQENYHLDFETYSPQPLGGQKSVGAYRYASDPEAEILCFAISRGGGPPATWDALNGGEEALGMFTKAVESDALIYAHNAQFEAAVCKYLLKKTFGFEAPKLEQWRCTAAMARLAAIPSSLSSAGEFLDIDTPKSKEGIRLINLFSTPRRATKRDPRTRIMPADEPEEFSKFVDYCYGDVMSEMQVHNKLKKDFPLEGWSLQSFQADLHMNDRGIPVNRAALEHASTLMDEFLARMVPLFREQVATEFVAYQDNTLTLPTTGQRKAPKVVDISEGFNPTQGELFKVWLSGEGWLPPNLQADTVEEKLATPGELTIRGQKALHTFSLIASAAVKKVPAMLKMACDDGYVRGALMVFGAERTHRWTGRGMQPQNFARPRIKFTALAYDMLCQGASLDEIESILGNYFDVLVSVIRHFIQPHEGDCLQADYSAIEARVAPWLVNEEATLQLFRDGVPVYERMATHIFGGGEEDVTGEQRFIGKQAVLGCTYNMGRPKFRGTCESYGFSPPPAMIESYKPRHRGTVQIAFSKFLASIERQQVRSGSDKRPDDHRVMQLMLKDKGWDKVGLTPENIYDPETDEQWVHLTYDDLADRAVTAWRGANPIIVKAWRALDDAAKLAIGSPGQVVHVGKLALCCKVVAGFDALLIKLPSGHKLVYPKARVVANRGKGWGTVVEFWGVLPNSGGSWGWCSTYGGKLLENATQATAGDVMRQGMWHAEQAGYQAFMLVHDEILTLMLPGQSHEELCGLLCKNTTWMEGLPLAAEGGQLPFYQK